MLPIFAGRACYQSFGEKAGRKSAEEYLGHIIESKHFSVLEHSSLTFYIEGVSRSLTHELVRHRHFSFSQLSQRYVDHSKEIGIVIPPSMCPCSEEEQEIWEARGRQWIDEYKMILATFPSWTDHTIKERREAARAVLPNCTETKIVVSGNLRSWMEFIEKRNSPAADAEIRRLASHIETYLRLLAPNIFVINGGDD